ncbi:hypothetical protein [Novosphingobium kunmingense]|nr:hypothetical protein [Novosphingobium kunmingense]
MHPIPAPAQAFFLRLHPVRFVNFQRARSHKVTLRVTRTNRFLARIGFSP